MIIYIKAFQETLESTVGSFFKIADNSPPVVFMATGGGCSKLTGAIKL